MENSPCFELNEAFRCWRTNLAQSPALRVADLDELETHLRDSVLALQASGLNEEDAFLVATRRIGDRQELAREFGKANLKGAWVDRSLWMIAGFLLFTFVAWLSQFVWIVVIRCTRDLALGAQWWSFVTTVPRSLLLVLAVVGFWLHVTRSHARLEQFFRLCVARPLIPIIAILTLHYGFLPIVHRWLLTLTVPLTRPESAAQFSILIAWSVWGRCFELVAWIALLCYLAWRQWQLSESPLLERKARATEDLSAPSRELTRALASKGLTAEEATFLATRRRGSTTAAIVEPEEARCRQVWVERGFWMIGGILIVRYALPDLSDVLQRLLLNVAGSWQINAHFLGFFLLCFQAAVVALLAAALGKFVARAAGTSSRSARFMLSRQMLGVAALAFFYLALYIGPVFKPSRLAWEVPTGYMSHRDLLVQQWNGYIQHYLITVVAVLLLFWLARGRLRFQESR